MHSPTQETPDKCLSNLAFIIQLDKSSKYRIIWLNSGQLATVALWWHSIVVKTTGSAGVLSLSCARLTAGRVTTLWVNVCYQSANKADSAFHPSGVSK